MTLNSFVEVELDIWIQMQVRQTCACVLDFAKGKIIFQLSSTAMVEDCHLKAYLLLYKFCDRPCLYFLQSYKYFENMQYAGMHKTYQVTSQSKFAMLVLQKINTLDLKDLERIDFFFLLLFKRNLRYKKNKKKRSCIVCKQIRF